MSKPKKKSVKIILGVLVAALMLGACFTCVALYAKKEMNKPVFTLPPEKTAPLPSASPLPEDAETAASYAERLFTEAASADDAEMNCRTEVSLDGDRQTPLTGADDAVLSYLCSTASGELSSLYPPQPDAPLHAAASAFTATEGEGENETDRRFITLEKDPASVDTAAMTQSETYAAIVERLSAALTVEDIQITATSIRENYTIDRIHDKLLSAEFVRSYSVRATIRMTDAYSALFAEPTVQVELPYTAKQIVSFKHYGAFFTKQAIAVRPGDMQTLPASITIRDNTPQDEFSLTFTTSVPDVLHIDSDLLMTVKGICDEPVTVTMTLEYGGRTYTDSITVYITRMEVKADV